MKWYVERLRTMSLREVFFRFKQQILFQTSTIKKYWKPQLKISEKCFRNAVLQPKLESKVLDLKQPIFQHFDDNRILKDWHLDISSGKCFPKSYSFNIDIRTDKYGSAKYVWEVNRMLSLPRLAANYRRTNDRNELILLIKHIESWEKENPYLIGVNWYSNIEVNIRLINWALTWEILDASNLVKSDGYFCEFVKKTWIPLIYQHCVYSATYPSLYSSANNHLISEYAGLFIANCLWTFPESDQWIKKAQQGLEVEIKKQHTEEGVNKEEAAEYIQFITDFFLLAYVFGEKSGHPFSKGYKEKLGEIFDYILNFLDVKGNFPQYGDEDDGKLTLLNEDYHASNFDSILVSAAIITKDSKFKLPRLKVDNKNLILFGEEGKKIFDNLEANCVVKSKFYPNSGHFIFRKNESTSKEIYLHFDVAPLGYLSIAAHGHADALSVILHLDGLPILVDSGTFTYHTHPEWRYFFISTLAHNTVCINNKNQAVNGGPLLWTKHYEVTVQNCNMPSELNKIEEVEGKHNGYQNSGIVHKRKVSFDIQNQVFTIIDTLVVEHKQFVDVKIPWHFHPVCEVIPLTDRFLVKRTGARNLYIEVDKTLNHNMVNGSIEPTIGWYSKSFYQKEPTNTILGQGNIEIVNEKTFVTKITIEK